jgi:enoyl-CoA hydratase/carnithine racemase
MPSRNPHLFDPAPILKDLQHVVYEKKDHVAYIRFNRPDRLNSLNQRMSLEMYSIWLDARRDKDVYVAIITGTGRAFQAGRDVKELTEAHQQGEMVPRDNPESIYHRVEAFPDLAEFNKPIIAAINGVCAGGGLSFMTRCHIRVMADDTYITDGHLNVGQLTSPYRYIQDFGWATAMYLFLCKGKLSAQECLRLGIVNEICPKEQVVERAAEYAKMMCEIAPSILEAGTELSNMAVTSDPTYDQLTRAMGQAARRAGSAGAAAAKAFTEKSSKK